MYVRREDSLRPFWSDAHFMVKKVEQTELEPCGSAASSPCKRGLDTVVKPPSSNRTQFLVDQGYS